MKNHIQISIKKLNICITSMFVFLITCNSNGYAQYDHVPKEIEPVDAPFETPAFKRPQFPDDTFNIIDYGAQKMDEGSEFKNTVAINKTIEAASRNGGGTVLIPKGDWLTGPIHFMSNINLHVVDGATVYFSEDKQDYLPVVHVRSGGVEAYNYSSPIYGYKVENIAITGKGTFDAQGEHWWKWMEKHNPTPRDVATKTRLSRRIYGKGGGEEGMRPTFIHLFKCNNILVEGITLQNTPNWNFNPVYCENIIVRDITIQSLEAPNGDGVALSSCKNVLVEYNHFETGDDAVVLKSGFNEEGRKINIPTKNVIVRNFQAKNVRTGSGGIVFGSETAGGIENIYVHNAYFEGADRGIRFKTSRGRGNEIKNIYIHDIEMKNIDAQAININTYYDGPQATGPAPLLTNVNIRDIKIDGVPRAITLNGLPEKWIEDISFENIEILNAEEGIRVTRGKNITFRNVSVESETRAMVADDVFELKLNNLTLQDSAEGNPLFLKGGYTGAVFLKDFDKDKLELGKEVSKEVIR